MAKKPLQTWVNFLLTRCIQLLVQCCFNLSLKILVTTHIYNYSVLIFFLSQLTLKYLLTFYYKLHCCFYSTLIFSKKQNSCVLLCVDFFCSKFSNYIIPYVYINSIHTRDGLCVFKWVICCTLHIYHIIHLEIENATVKILNKQSQYFHLFFCQFWWIIKMDYPCLIDNPSLVWKRTIYKTVLFVVVNEIQILRKKATIAHFVERTHYVNTNT